MLSPGPGRPENAGICIEVVKKFAPQFPILGVCLGHQAIAVAFGAKVINADEIAHGKMTTIYHDDDPLFKKFLLLLKAVVIIH
nr:gamma-glutamyl-gamma-aminobutyrate hydrolase family protein [Coxiella burnetii]